MLAPPLYVERLTLASKSVNSSVEHLCASTLIPVDPAWLEQHSSKCLFQPLDSTAPTGPTAASGSSGGRPSAPPVARCIASICFETVTQLDLKISRSPHPNALYIGALASTPTPWRLPQLQNAANLMHEALLALNLLLERARRLTSDSTSQSPKATPSAAATISNSSSSGVLAAAAALAPAPTAGASAGQSPRHQKSGNASASNAKLLPLLPTLYHRSLVHEALSKLQLARRTLECPTRRSVAELLALRQKHPLSPPLPADMALSLFVEETRLCLALYMLAQLGASPAPARLEIVHSQVLESALPSLLVVLPRLRTAIRLLEQVSCETL